MERIILALSLTLIMGCTHGQCSNLPQRPVDAPSGSTETAGDTQPDTVKVFKDVGKKQCGSDNGVSLESVNAVLVKNGIKVIDAKTQKDGKEHITACGATTGDVHVFVIPQKSLKRALALGFTLFR